MENEALKEKLHQKSSPPKARKSKEISYACNECQKCFVIEDELEEHLSHEDFKFRFLCRKCQKGFNKKKNLDDHIKSHDKKTDTSIKCTLCSINFKTEELLSNHTMSQHPRKFDTLKEPEETGNIVEQQHNCMECDYQTNQNANLNKHMEVAHKTRKSNMPFKCKDCAKEFKARWSLMNHRRDTHGKAKKKCIYKAGDKCKYGANDGEKCWYDHSDSDTTQMKETEN